MKTCSRLSMWEHGDQGPSHLQLTKLPVEYKLFYKHSDRSFQWLLTAHSEKVLMIFPPLPLYYFYPCYSRLMCNVFWWSALWLQLFYTIISIIPSFLCTKFNTYSFCIHCTLYICASSCSVEHLVTERVINIAATAHQ